MQRIVKMMIHLASENTESNLSEFTPNQVQPNAIDLRIDKIFSISSNEFIIDEEQKQHRGSFEVPVDKDGYWNLNQGTYEVLFEGIIDIGPFEAGFVITRSTFNRNGVFFTSGLYDSGYKGVMAGAMHVTIGGNPAGETRKTKIKKGTRAGQFLLFKAESVSTYDGDYGIDKEHDKKYG